MSRTEAFSTLTRNFLHKSRRLYSIATPLHASASPSSIAVVGSGAVGGYYGARLWETGQHDVTFHMRGEHYRKSKSDGLNVTSVNGDIFIPPDVLKATEDTSTIGKVDWVIVALKSSALDAIPALIEPLLEPGRTRVLAIMNGLIEDDLIRSLKEYVGEDSDSDALQCCAALYGGMALVCSNRLGPGRIDHSYAGKLSGGVAASCPTITHDDNLSAFEQLWSGADVEIAVEKSLLAGRWRKVMRVMNNFRKTETKKKTAASRLSFSIIFSYFVYFF